MIREFICKDPEFQECHASTIIALPRGEYLASWFAGTKEGNNDVYIVTCRRTKSGWKKPVKVAKVKNLPHWNPVLHYHNKEVTLFFKVGKNCSHWKTWVMRSADNGRTWTMPEELVAGNIGGRGPVKNKCIVLSDGTWLAPASSEIGVWQSFVDRSCDNGRTWERTRFIPQDRHKLGIDKDGNDFFYGTIQPALWESEPGKVHMLMRSNCGKICRSDSNDNGFSWSRVYETSLKNNNSGIDLDKLKNGTLLMAHNPSGKNWGPRWPMRISISTDNGKSWKKLIDTETVKKHEFSYPAVLATNDGGAVVTYTWDRKNIVFVKFDVNEIL